MWPIVHEPNMNGGHPYAAGVALWPTSLRSRLAALFAAGAGILLLGSSLFLWQNLTGELDAAVTAGLRQRAADVAADASADLRAVPAGVPATVASEVLDREPFAQVLVGQAVVGASPNLRSRPAVVTPAEVEQAADGDVVLDRSVPGLGRRSRLLIEPVAQIRPTVVVVIGTSLDANVRAQRRLRLVLAVSSPVLLGFLAAAGWLLAGAALRPVRKMTEQAAAISLANTGRRLPLPRGEDEIALLGTTLNGMLDRIEDAVAHERRFLDDASHELRTPIAILRAELELALLDADSEAATEALGSALEEAERLARMADDLLVLARADAGHAPPRAGPATASVRVAALELADLWEVGETGVSIRVEGDAAVTADRMAVDQILTNLMGNARRFARSAVLVRVSTEAHDRVVVEVADDGPGFPPDLLPRAFDRFARSVGARTREAGGAGLGLAIVAALATAAGGTAEASNGPPLGGGCVRVTLPSPRA